MWITKSSIAVSFPIRSAFTPPEGCEFARHPSDVRRTAPRWRTRKRRRRVRRTQRNYQQYLELARAEALTGNTVGAENYYQHAEHYFRSMSSDRGAT
jgi:hypothetical protein